MAIEEQLRRLAESQVSLVALQQRLCQNRSLMNREVTQTFIFELRDYADSLSIVTDFVEGATAKEVGPTEISTVLSEQNQLVHTLVEELAQLIEENGELFGQKEGELRRTWTSLQGVLELNSLMLQDNLGFQRMLNDQLVDLDEVPAVCKQGFFQRLLSKR